MSSSEMLNAARYLKGRRLAACGAALGLLMAVATVHSEVPDRTPLADWDRLKEVLQRDVADTAWRDEEGHTLIFYQLFFGSEELAVDAIRRRPRSKALMEGSTRLMDLAIRRGSQRVVQALLEHGDNPNAMRDMDASPLMLAAAEGQLEIIRILANAGANLAFERANRGGTAMTSALSAGQVYSLKLLLDLGAKLSIDGAANGGKSLVFYSIDGGSVGTLTELLHRGFEINRPRSSGLPPLHYALSRQSSPELIEAILDAKGDPCLRGDSGRTARDVVRQVGVPSSWASSTWLSGLMRSEACPVR